MSQSDRDQPCAVDDCPSRVGLTGVRSMCPAHYARWKRYGDPTFSPGPSGVPRRPLAERFWPKVDQRGPDECWPWTGHVKRNGYGAITLGGKSGKIEMAHRAAWIVAFGEIPDGMVVDHKCRVRHCVNVRHLQVVTQAENQQNRGAQFGSLSGVRNVGWNEARQAWEVRVVVGGEQTRGGFHESLVEAEAAAVALRNRLMTNNLIDR